MWKDSPNSCDIKGGALVGRFCSHHARRFILPCGRHHLQERGDPGPAAQTACYSRSHSGCRLVRYDGCFLFKDGMKRSRITWT